MYWKLCLIVLPALLNMMTFVLLELTCMPQSSQYFSKEFNFCWSPCGDEKTLLYHLHTFNSPHKPQEVYILLVRMNVCRFCKIYCSYCRQFFCKMFTCLKKMPLFNILSVILKQRKSFILCFKLFCNSKAK